MLTLPSRRAQGPCQGASRGISEGERGRNEQPAANQQGEGDAAEDQRTRWRRSTGFASAAADWAAKRAVQKLLMD